MTTWELPEPPGTEVIVLRDETGREFVRLDGAGEYWISEALGAGRGTYSWVDLLTQRGTVTADVE